MLTARKVSRVCPSCHSHLQLLYELGFSTSVTPLRLRPLAQQRGLVLPLPSRARCSLQLRNLPRRSLSTSRRLLEEGIPASGIEGGTKALGDAEAAILPNADSKNSVEDVVRHAKQTFGDTLPKDFLSEEEYLLYERFYGPPVRETRGDDFEILDSEGATEGIEGAQSGKGRNVLLRENDEGEFEEVDFDPEFGYAAAEGEELAVVDETETVGEEMVEDEWDVEGGEASQELRGYEGSEVVQIGVKSQRELDAILRLQRDMNAAAAQPVEEEEDMDEEFEEEEEEEEDEQNEEDESEPDAYLSGESIRAHPRTIIGRWGTSPRTIQLPQEQFVLPITELLSRTNFTHLTEAAEKAFGGPALPYSTSTPASKKLLPQKHIGLEAGQYRMSEIEADAYMAVVIPGIYASVMSTLVEVRKRLGSSWIRGLFDQNGGEGPRVLDAGAGGSGVIAWRELLAAEWDLLRSEGLVPGNAPIREGKSTVLTGPSALRHRVSRFLENTTFLPRLPDYLHSSNPEELLDGAPAEGRKSFDVIIAPHTLFPLKEDYRRKRMVETLWSLLSPNGGVLILIEKGLPRGFEAIAGARSHLLKKHIRSPSSTHLETATESSEERFVEKEEGMIIAPCTNHSRCPMYKTEGLTSGRKDFCHFVQRYERPGFLQKILKAKSRNHDDLKFSYLAVQRGIDLRQSSSTATEAATSNLMSGPQILQGDSATDAALAGYEDLDTSSANLVGAEEAPEFSPFSLPRAVLPPLKRRGHVTLDLCTPSGTLERWTVPRSFSAQAYRDARKSSHGDLWALGAKTRVLRDARVGRGGSQSQAAENPGKGWMKSKDGKTRRPRPPKKRNVFEVEVGEKGMERVREVSDGRADRSEKRTRGGRVWKDKKEIGLDDF